MKNFLVKTLLVAFFLSVAGAVFAKMQPAGFRVSYESDSLAISMTTPEDWVYDDSAVVQKNRPALYFSQYEKPGKYSANKFYILSATIFEGRAVPSEEYIKLSTGQRNGYNISAKKLDLKLENAKNWKNYGIYELSDHPEKYKDLMLVIQTKHANITVFLSCALNKNATEENFQASAAGFYEMIKTIEIREIEKQFPAGYKASFERDPISVSMITPKGWICDFDFAKKTGRPLGFLQEKDYDEGEFDGACFMSVICFDWQSFSAETYFKNYINSMKKEGIEISAKKLDVKLDNAKNWLDYGIYEISGYPDKYKDLTFFVQTKYACMLLIYTYRLNDNMGNKRNTTEKDFQSSAQGFYAMIKTIEINELLAAHGSTASYESNSFIIDMTTPKDWVYDYRYAKKENLPLLFFEENSFSDKGIDMTRTMFMSSYEGRYLSAKAYMKWDIANLKKQGTKVKAKKLDIKLDNGNKWKDYALYEYTGVPNKYKELMLVIQTDKANIYVVYSYTGSGGFVRDPKGLEKDFQEHAAGFYEMIKTIKISEK